MIERLNLSKNAFSTLVEDITSEATSLKIQSEDVNKFPETPFKVMIDSEIILVKEVSDNVFSDLTRGDEDTEKSAHSAGDMITGNLTIGTLETMWDDTERRLHLKGGTMEGNVDYNENEIRNAKLVDCEGTVGIFVDNNPNPEDYEEGDIILMPSE